MIKVATWNVNSIRVRLPQVVEWLKKNSPDIMVFQETKVTDDLFPKEEIEALNYHVLCSGQRAYNGVALFSKECPTDVIYDLPHLSDPQRRVIGATIGNIRLLNLYVPNGESVGSEKYQYKMEWLKTLTEYVHAQLKIYSELVVLGDFNIAPEDRDVYDPRAWAGHVLVSPKERDALKVLLKEGLQDAFRLFEQPKQAYSWWDYRGGAFWKNHGLRLDLILLSQALASRCTKCEIDTHPRKRKQASDHAPVVVELQ